MQMGVTHENVIDLKANLYKAGRVKGLRLSDKQVEAFAILFDKETDELLYGGAAGGAKSWLGCEWLLWNCIAYPETRWFIGRHHLSQIRKSTIETFKKVCKKHNISSASYKYNDQTVKIVFQNGSTIDGIEMMHKPGDPEFDGFGSTEYTGGWIEEGGGIAFKAYEIASTRIGRHYNDRYGIRGKLLITGNPSRNWMYSLFYKPHRDGILHVKKKFMQSLVTDNPFVDSGYVEKLDGLKGQTRERLRLGNWDFINDPLALIDAEAIQDLFSNEFVVPNTLEKYLIIDVAMHGDDKLRAGVFYGDVMIEEISMKKSGGQQVLSLAKQLQSKHRIQASHILYDGDGVGAFMGGEGGFIPGAIAFHGNAVPIIPNKDESKFDRDRQQKQKSEYANLKAQCGYLLANDINEGKMWAKCVTSQEEREMLSEELAQIKASQANGDGALRLMEKKLIVQAIGRSPDFSDLFLMKKYFDLQKLVKRKPFTRPMQGIQ
jgi:phage terminase large subunit